MDDVVFCQEKRLMSIAYSYALRLRVMKSVEEGMSAQQASKIYKISRKVIYDCGRN